jgi:glycosyltransferase involved in cell wall biosynthesis
MPELWKSITRADGGTPDLTAQAQVKGSHPLRILLVIEAAGGGAGRHVLDLARGLASRGHQVALAWSPHRAETAFRDAISTLPAVRLHQVRMQRSPGPGDFSATLAIRRLIRDAGPFDIVHGHSSKAGALARLAAMGVRVPVIYTPHALVTMDPDMGRLHHAAYQFAELTLAGLASRIICVSEEERAHAAMLGINPAKLVVIPNGIARLAPADRTRARTQLGLDELTPCVGFVGRLSAQKAVARLLRAFRLAALHDQAHLVIAGEGPDREALESLARELGLQNLVTFTGQTDGPALMAGFDLFVLSSRYEAFPYVLLEALARGLPIVTTAVGGARAVVQDGANGFVVPEHDDPSMLAQRIGELLANPARRTAMGAASLERAPSFSHERMVERTLSVYEEVLGHGQSLAAGQ